MLRITVTKGEGNMSGIEIVVGVIIGILFELLSNTEGTPSEHGIASNKVDHRFRTVEIGLTE